jgi:hypothetical protein
MAAEIGPHKCALRNHLQAAGPDIGERIADQAAGEAPPLERWVDLGVNEDDRLRQRAVFDGPDAVVSDPELVAILGLVVDEACFAGDLVSGTGMALARIDFGPPTVVRAVASGREQPTARFGGVPSANRLGPRRWNHRPS